MALALIPQTIVNVGLNFIRGTKNWQFSLPLCFGLGRGGLGVLWSALNLNLRPSDKSSLDKVVGRGGQLVGQLIWQLKLQSGTDVIRGHGSRDDHVSDYNPSGECLITRRPVPRLPEREFRCAFACNTMANVSSFLWYRHFID